MFAFRAEVAKEKKALEAEYDAGLEVIFNYGYGCYAFAHNICGSKLGIPARMPGMSNPLPPKLFVSPRCPSGVGPGEAVAAPEVDISEEVEHSSAARAKVGDSPDSQSRVAGEREEPGHLARVRDCILCLLTQPCSFAFVLYLDILI